MLRLRPYKQADARKIVTWVADHRAFSAWCADRLEWPFTEGSLEKCRLDCLEKEDRWMMTALGENGQPVGFLVMSQANYSANSIHLGMIIVDPACRGQGIGTAFIKLVLAYARDILGMERATLRVFAHNGAARACYRKAGFQEIRLEQGRLRHGEEIWDCWNMEAQL